MTTLTLLWGFSYISGNVGGVNAVGGAPCPPFVTICIITTTTFPQFLWMIINRRISGFSSDAEGNGFHKRKCTVNNSFSHEYCLWFAVWLSLYFPRFYSIYFYLGDYYRNQVGGAAEGFVVSVVYWVAHQHMATWATSTKSRHGLVPT